jgi:hypothetical protein
MREKPNKPVAKETLHWEFDGISERAFERCEERDAEKRFLRGKAL